MLSELKCSKSIFVLKFIYHFFNRSVVSEIYLAGFLAKAPTFNMFNGFARFYRFKGRKGFKLYHLVANVGFKGATAVRIFGSGVIGFVTLAENVLT